MASDMSKLFQAGVRVDLNTRVNTLTDELVLSGYSLSVEDVMAVVMAAIYQLAGWGRFDDDISPNMSLLMDDWVIIEPVIRAHCDLIQARRMEGVQSLGMTTFNILASEALSLYNQAIETMKKEAFCQEPFTVALDENTSLSQQISQNGAIVVVGGRR